MADLQMEVANLRRELAVMRASRSWYLTRPLRFAYQRLQDMGAIKTTPAPQPVTTRPASSATEASPPVAIEQTTALSEISGASDGESAPAGYLLNDGAFWDAYVRDWEASPDNAALRCLGNEWKNEEVFLDFLARYAVAAGQAFEIGCGGGRITREAVGLFASIRAGDVSQEMLRKCKEAVNAPNLTFQVLDGFTLGGVPDRSIDVVYSHDVFVHFSSLQVYAYLEEIRRVLKAGGVGLISFYNFFVSFDLFKEMSLNFRNSRMFPPHMRVHFLTEAMLQAMLKDLDLEPIEVDTSKFLVVAFRRPSRGAAGRGR